METKKYFSKYYQGERQPPQTLSSKGVFFWNYEKSFYTTNPNPSKEEFDEWLEDLLCNYLPYKMMGAPLQDEEQLIKQWKLEYDYS